MAIKFAPTGSNEANYAKITTDLTSSTNGFTLCWHARYSSTSAQGTMGGLSFSSSAYYSSITRVTSGSQYNYLYIEPAGVDWGAPNEIAPADTWWFYAVRMDEANSVNSGNAYCSVYDGSAWKYGQSGGSHIHFNSSIGPSNFSVDTLYFGVDDPSFPTFGRNYVIDNLEVAYVRWWEKHLTDGELESERTSATPLVSGCRKHFKCISSLSDELGGDPLSVNVTDAGPPQITAPTTNANVPAYVVESASTAKNLLLPNVGQILAFGNSRQSF